MTKLQIMSEAKRYYVAMQLNEILPPEVYELYVKPNFNTASWRFYNGVHKIVIGENIFKNFKKKRSPTQDKKYLKAFLNHEFSHSLWTDKELNKIARILKKEKMSFTLFNLFEDARIEEKMRHYIKKKFDWLEYEEKCAPSNMVAFFYYIVQCEHSSAVMSEYVYVDEFQDVLAFYKRVIACLDSFEVIEVMKEWYEMFPETREDLKEMQNLDYLYVVEARCESDAAFEAILEDCVEVLGVVGTKAGEGHSSIKVDSTQEGSLLSEYSVSSGYSMQDRDRLIQEMQKHFMQPKRYKATELPSKRLNLKRLSSGSKKLFKRKEQEKEYKHKLNIILDLSGSMEESIHNMRLIVDVLNVMTLKGLIEANLILTGVTFNGAEYEVIPMPLPENTIERLVASFWGEGLDNTLRSNLALLKQADYNWVLTDGYIDEKPLNKEFYTREGVHMHAMYIGDANRTKQLEHSFNHVMCERDVISLTRKIFMLFVIKVTTE